MRSTFLPVALAAAACGTISNPPDGGLDAGGPSPSLLDAGLDGALTDAAADVAAPIADAGDGVRCGSQTCAPPTICCAFDAGAGTAVACVGAPACSGTAVACDGPEDCGGGICCADGPVGATCQAGGSACAEPLCHDATDCGPSGWQCCLPRRLARPACVPVGGTCVP